MLGCCEMERQGEREGGVDGGRIEGHTGQWGLCGHLSETRGEAGGTEWKRHLGGCVSVDWVGGRQEWKDVAKSQRQETCEAEIKGWKRGNAVSSGRAPCRSLYRPECTFWSGRGGGKATEGGSNKE